MNIFKNQTVSACFVLSCFSHVRQFATLWTVCSLPGSSVHGILRARMLERIAMPSSKGSSQPKDQTRVSYVSCIGRLVLYHYHAWEAPIPQAEYLQIHMKKFIRIINILSDSKFTLCTESISIIMYYFLRTD